ncbi:hypothetical protein [Henriciella marina]|uniref:hypothetical protein n=1 Tax=Henriciella marina TaxID=453851 RepID=UPI00037A81D3|nr:hypothetical protein [Henriciella marina]
MAFDVLLVSAMGDSDKATILARKLRALKFRVRYDAKREHTTPSSRDLSDCNKAASVLVLWSAGACDTSKPDADWVHAMAHLARSRPDALVQANLDETVPDDPFDKDKRFDLTGLTSRKTPDAFGALCETLGQKDGREGLADWLALASSDEAGKLAWKEAHPTDPLAQKGARKAATPEKPKSEAPSEDNKPRVTSAAAASAAATAQIADASHGHRLELKPPNPAVDFADNRPGGGARGLLILVPTGLVLVGMLVLAFVYRNPVTQLAGPGASGGIVNVMETCPAGQVPRSLVHSSLLPSEHDEAAGEIEADPVEID